METQAQSQPKVPRAQAQRDPILVELFEKISQAELARRMTAEGHTMERSTVNNWKRVPDKHVRLVAKISGFSLKKLRADLYDFSKSPGAEPEEAERLSVEDAQDQKVAEALDDHERAEGSTEPPVV